MVLLGLTFGLFESIFFLALIVCLTVGISFDRRGREEPKWYIFGFGLIAVAAWFWKDWTFAGAWASVCSWTFWEPMLAYLLAGLVYSIIEFILDIRRSAREYKAMWAVALEEQIVRLRTESVKKPGFMDEERMPLKEALIRCADFPAEHQIHSEIKDVIGKFIGRSSRNHAIVEVVRGEFAPEPKINKVELSEHIGAWTFFWPFYLISLIIGDLLTEVFNILSDFFVSLSGRFVRMSFKDVFKF